MKHLVLEQDYISNREVLQKRLSFEDIKEIELNKEVEFDFGVSKLAPPVRKQTLKLFSKAEKEIVAIVTTYFLEKNKLGQEIYLPVKEEVYSIRKVDMIYYNDDFVEKLSEKNFYGLVFKGGSK